MAISEQLVISARLDLSGVASDVDKLRSQLESASKVSTASLDIEGKKAALLDARIAKEQASVSKISATKDQAAAKEQSRLDALIAKQEQAAQREVSRKDALAQKEQARLDAEIAKRDAALARESAKRDAAAAKEIAAQEKIAQKEQARLDSQIAKREAASAKESARQEAAAQKQQQIAANTIAQLEKQKAASAVRATDGGDKEAARIAQETLRYKQQIAAIDAKIFNSADIANAKALAAEINKLNLEKIKKGFDDASPVTFNQFIGATTEKARDLAEQLQNTSQTLERVSTAFNQITKASGEAFLAFDSAKVKVSTLTKDSERFGLQAKSLANQLGNQSTSTEILAANYQILSSGFNKTNDVLAITKASLIGATAGFTDVETVADALTSVLNAYGLQASESNKIIDQFIVTQDRGKVVVAEFAQNLGNVIPISANAKVRFEEVQGALASLTMQGVKSDIAITNIKNVIQDIVAPSKQAAAAFASIGVTNTAATLRTEGLIGVLKRLRDAGKTSAEDIAKFFGDIRSQSGVSGLLKGGLEQFEEITNDITNRGGKALEDYTKRSESAQGRVTAAFNKINEALINLGGGVVRAFSPLIAAVGGAVDLFNQLPEPIQTVLGGLIGLIGGVATLGAALTAIGAAAPAFVGGLKLLGFEAGRATIASVALTTATNVQAATYAILSKEITFSAIAQSANTAKTIVATAVTNAWTAAVALGSTQITWLGVKTAASALIAKASFASFATGIAGLLTPLGLVAAAIGALVIGAKPLADAFNVSNSTKSIDDLKNKLKELRAERGKVDPVESTKDDRLGAKQGTFVNPFDTRLSEQKEVIKFSEAQKEYNLILDQSKNLLAEYGLTGAEAGDRVRLGAKGIEEFTKKADEQKQEIDATIESLKAQAGQAGDNPVLRQQLNNEIAIFSSRKKLLDDRLKFLKESTDKETAIIEEATKEQRKKAERILEERNQDKELGIKRSQEDDKTKRDRENADAIKEIEEKNTRAKGELDRKQALETGALKERQNRELQDKQRAFDNTQNAKKIAFEDALDAKRRANEDKLNNLKQAFDDNQAAAREARAERLRKEDEAFAEQRAARDKQASEALSGAKQLISNEGAIATAKPEDRAKIAAQIAEEERIRAQAATQGVSGAETQEQLVARAKQLARVQAIANGEEQKKVELAIAELDKANKAKQAEIDKAELEKRTEARRASDKAFEDGLNASKRAFDAEQNTAKLNFENTVLKPEKEKIEAELNASKLAFERGELAALKAQQASDEEALKLQQTNKDLALKKAADAELDAIKTAQKQKEIEIDRAFEDQKIERERAFKESQRALDKASAIEIQQILGQSAQQIINALTLAKGDSKFGAVAGIGSNVAKGDGNALSNQDEVNRAALGASTLRKVRAFANGGVSNGGLALVGERGAELVNLPKGASVTPANDTRSLLSRGSDNSRVEALLEKLIGSVNRPNLEIKTTDDPATIAADIYRKSAAQDLRRSGL